MKLLDVFKSKQSQTLSIVERLLEQKQITAKEATILLSGSQYQIRIGAINVEASTGAKIIAGDNTDYQ